MIHKIDVHEVFARRFAGNEALAYALSSKLEQGNICFNLDDYLISDEEASKEFNPFFSNADEFRESVIHGDYISKDPDVLQPFLYVNGNVYLQRYYHYETLITENIKHLGDRLKIITGGPGTGKTYSVSTRLVELFDENPQLKVALAAPTGKAATRMNESIAKFVDDEKEPIRPASRDKLTGLKAQTIHMLLGTIPNSVFFRHNRSNQLPFQVVVVDECSMIDVAMMAKLLEAIGDDTRVFLLGDKDQLASVEAGSIFGDLCRMKDSDLLRDRIKVLTESHRFKADRGIGRLSSQVISGDIPAKGVYESDDEITIDFSRNHNLFKQNALKYKEFISEGDIGSALKKLNRVRFLCATRELEHSVSDCNTRIEKILRAEFKDTEDFRPGKGLYHNQPIIITRNDYNLGVRNGDVGIVRKEGEELIAWFEDTENPGQQRFIRAGYLNHFETVFAMTIHKSQGSEFDHVVLILPGVHGKKLLTRELLYTGISRAISSVLIQAEEKVLEECIKSEVARTSGIKNRV